MSTNGKQHPRRPRIEVRQGRAAVLAGTTFRLRSSATSASPEEAAAIAAAIEHFLRDTAPAPQAPGNTSSPWLRAGLYENAGLDPLGPGPWGGRPSL